LIAKSKRARRIAGFGRPWARFHSLIFPFSFEANQKSIQHESVTASLYHSILFRQWLLSRRASRGIALRYALVADPTGRFNDSGCAAMGT
jgi:hypothetical protein